MSAFNYEAMTNSIRTYIEAQLGASNDLPIFYDNAPELAADAAETDPKSYLKIAILHGTAFQADMGSGNDRWRRPGVIQISIYIELGKGTGRSNRIADQFVTMMRGKTITVAAGDIKFNATSPKPGSVEGAYWRVDVDSSFYSDDFDS